MGLCPRAVHHSVFLCGGVACVARKFVYDGLVAQNSVLCREGSDASLPVHAYLFILEFSLFAVHDQQDNEQRPIRADNDSKITKVKGCTMYR